MTERNAYRSDLKPPPGYYLVEEMITLDGSVKLEKTVPQHTLVPGVNPYHQIIYAIVSELGKVRIETIYKSLIKEYRVMPDTGIARQAIDDIIEIMDYRAHLLYYIEKGVFHYKAGRSLDVEEVHFIDFKPGYDPIAWHILDAIKNNHTMNRDMINEFIMKDMGWITSMNSLDYYLESLEKGELWGANICSQETGNILRVRENTYQYQYPLESWGEKTLSNK